MRMSAPTEAEATAMGFTEQSENFWVKPPGRYQTKKHEKYLCKHCGKESDYRTEEKGRHLASCVLTKPIYFSDIPPFPSHRYEVNISWDYLEQHLHDEMNPGDGMAALNLDPDFQRAHVWTETQQREYVEYVLRGGEVGRSLTFNCVGWGGDYRGPYEIIDGKQRLEAVRKFMRSELRVFGFLRRDFGGRMRIAQSDFRWRVCSLETKAEVLQLYLNINAGGTPHTAEELNKVREMLGAEINKEAQA